MEERLARRGNLNFYLLSVIFHLLYPMNDIVIKAENIGGKYTIGCANSLLQVGTGFHPELSWRENI